MKNGQGLWSNRIFCPAGGAHSVPNDPDDGHLSDDEREDETKEDKKKKKKKKEVIVLTVTVWVTHKPIKNSRVPIIPVKNFVLTYGPRSSLEGPSKGPEQGEKPHTEPFFF